MCKYCEPLINCPVGQKRKSIILNETRSNVDVNVELPADAPIPKIHTIVEMVKDRYSDHSEVFIHTSLTDIYKNWENIPFDINYCPMCGEKL